jgi:hypothetical protein
MDYSILLKAPLFRGLSVEEIERMLAIVSYRTRKFKSGTLIVQSGEQVNSLMVVIKGIVKGEMTDFAGRVIKIEDIPAPGALGEIKDEGIIEARGKNIKILDQAGLVKLTAD